MTAYTSSVRVGPPLSGTYAVTDTFTDANGTIFECKKSGRPGLWDIVGPTTVASTTTVNVGAAAGTGVVATEYGNSVVHQTLLTITSLPQAVVNGTEYQGTKIYDFPEGRILLLGLVATIAQKTTSAILSTLNGSSTGSLGIGSATASSTTLATTMVDMLPATAFTSSATINVAGTAVSNALAASAQFDGHTTAIDMFINTAYATTTDVDADATQTLTGTVKFTWILLGDY